MTGAVAAVSAAPSSSTVFSRAIPAVVVAATLVLACPSVAARGGDCDGSEELHPSWSADGTTIAFMNAYAHCLFTVRARGGRVTTIGLAQEGSVSWSPKGARLAYETFTGRTRVLATVRGDGVGRALIGSTDTNGAWSPDGSTIAFVPAPGGVWLAKADGSGRRALVSADAVSALGPPPTVATAAEGPTWTPDGRKVVFSIAASRAGYNVWPGYIGAVMADGSGFHTLPSAQGYEYAPQVSADGRFVATDDYGFVDPTTSYEQVTVLGLAAACAECWAAGSCPGGSPGAPASPMRASSAAPARSPSPTPAAALAP